MAFCTFTYFQVIKHHIYQIQALVRHLICDVYSPLQWRHNEHDDVSSHQRPDCLRNRLFRGRSKKTSNLRVTGLCAGNSPVNDEFPAQRASNAKNVSIWWRHHVQAPERQRMSYLVHNGAVKFWGCSPIWPHIMGLICQCYRTPGVKGCIVHMYQ